MFLNRTVKFVNKCSYYVERLFFVISGSYSQNTPKIIKFQFQLEKLSRIQLNDQDQYCYQYLSITTHYTDFCMYKVPICSQIKVIQYYVCNWFNVADLLIDHSLLRPCWIFRSGEVPLTFQIENPTWSLTLLVWTSRNSRKFWLPKLNLNVLSMDYPHCCSSVELQTQIFSVHCRKLKESFLNLDFWLIKSDEPHQHQPFNLDGYLTHNKRWKLEYVTLYLYFSQLCVI